MDKHQEQIDIDTTKEQQQLPTLEAFGSRDSFSKQEGANPVNDAKNKLDNMIEDLNGKLVNHFKMKEEALLNQYKQELIEQQRQLNELKNNTNEQQIRNKMLERKSELEKERNHLIQTNMFFSQKCEQYKQTYSKLVQDSNDLEKEIKFLDQQINAANSKRLTLLDQASGAMESDEKLTGEINVYTDKKIAIQTEKKSQVSKKQMPTTDRTQKSSSLKKIAKSLHVSSQAANLKRDGVIKKINKMDPKILDKTQLQKLFEESIEEIKDKRKSKRTMPSLKGQQFTEYEKRAIMEVFLGKEEVKKKIYDIIFAESDKNSRSNIKAEDKVKISFDELGLS